jgi:hypothetical protein
VNIAAFITSRTTSAKPGSRIGRAGVAQIEDLLSKHAAFLSFLETTEQ